MQRRLVVSLSSNLLDILFKIISWYDIVAKLWYNHPLIYTKYKLILRYFRRHHLLVYTCFSLEWVDLHGEHNKIASENRIMNIENVDRMHFYFCSFMRFRHIYKWCIINRKWKKVHEPFPLPWHFLQPWIMYAYAVYKMKRILHKENIETILPFLLYLGK